MALRTKMRDFLGRDAVDQVSQIQRVRRVAVVEKEANPVHMGICTEEIDAGCIECARAANDPVNFVSFLEEEVCEVRPVLAGDACFQREPRCR